MAKTDKELCYMTATEALKRFKGRTLSPVELMRAVIARSEEVNPKVNAYTYTFFDRALKEAKEAEDKYMKSSADLRPLEGIPTVIKDLHNVKGEITTWGSKIYEGFVPDKTIPPVQRLFDAGVIMHARSTTPEFAHTAHCHSPLWGATRNPWNLDYSSGGSTGGGAAALATGMTTLSDGCDGGGSSRIPASACGVLGYKPPIGRTPFDILPTNIETLLVFGPLTRSVADAALMQNVVSGPDWDSILAQRPKLEIPEKLEGISGWKIAFSMDLGYFEVDTEVQKNTREALEVFKGLGCQVDEIDLGWRYDTYDAWRTHWESLIAALCVQYIPRWQYEMDRFVRILIQAGMPHSAIRYIQTDFVRTNMFKKLGPTLKEYNVLLCPTTAVPSVGAWHECDDPNFKINGKPIDAYLGWVLTYPFNLLGECPVATVPSGFASSGVPTGLQIVGAPWDDVSVFRAAAAYEEAKPWRDKHPEL